MDDTPLRRQLKRRSWLSAQRAKVRVLLADAVSDCDVVGEMNLQSRLEQIEAELKERD